MAADAVDMTTPTSFIEHPRETMNDVIERHAGEEGVHVFYACGTNVQLIRESEGDQVFNHQGLPVGRPHPGLRYSFAPSGAIAVREGQDVRPDGPNGEDQDAVEWLMSHPNLNMFFWEAGNEPDRQRPLESDYLKAVHTALSNGEEVKLVALLEEEMAGHKRQVLVDAANSALDALRKSRSEQEQALRHSRESTELREPVPPAEPLDRAAAFKTLTERGVSVTDDATDEQLQAVLLVTAPTTAPRPSTSTGEDAPGAPAETPRKPKPRATRSKAHGRARGRRSPRWRGARRRVCRSSTAGGRASSATPVCSRRSSKGRSVRPRVRSPMVISSYRSGRVRRLRRCGSCWRCRRGASSV